MGSRVLVCGGRDYAGAAYVAEMLNALDRVGSISEVIHGGAPGADRLANNWACERGIFVRDFPADWKAHGKAAGPIRNQRMIDEAKPDYVVAFPGGKGTADMVRRAEAAGIHVVHATPNAGGDR